MAETQTLPSDTAVTALIDHALLKPDLTTAEFDAGIALATKYGVYSVCVRPTDITSATNALAGTGVRVGTVVGFPHGSATLSTKIHEVGDALARGAVEIDFVLNIAALINGDDAYIAQECQSIAIVAQAGGAEKTKVILETAYLNDDQIVRACKLAEAAGVNFVKTSTGFAPGGATLPHVQLMRASVGPQVEVKASGGVRDLDTLLAMRAVGVTRFGTSATAHIIDELRARTAGVSVDSAAYIGDY